MKNDCVASLDHVQTVSKGRIGAYITTLSENKMRALCKALSFALSCKGV